MEYYKKYRIIENISHAQSINHVIDFFHKLPIIGKLTGDKYRLYGFKKFVYLFGPIFSLLGQIIKCLASFSVSLNITGAIIWGLNRIGLYKIQELESLMDYGVANLAFLSFYLTPALMSNSIEGGKFKIRELNDQYRMEAKESGLILGVFDPLRIGLGRIPAFWILFGLKKAALLSLSLAFIRISINTYNLYISRKKEKRLSEKFAFIIILEAMLFALLLQVKSISMEVLLPILVISIFAFSLSIKYLYKFDGYDRLLEAAKKDSANIDVDYDTIANDSLALKDSDIDKEEKVSGSGYEILNKLFFQRHRRLLIKPVLKKDLIIFAVLTIVLILVKFILRKYIDVIDSLFFAGLPIMAMLLFYDTQSSRAFFLNCDRALMQYGFYRGEKAIFDMYKARYISLLKINLGGLMVGLAGLILYYFLYQSMDMKLGLLAGGYILGTYLFYQAFNLFNYYVFQPFNYDASAKGGMYKFIGSLISYTNILIIPFIIGNLDVGINKLFVVLLVIMLIMVLIFPLIVKKYGKKTFKIRK